MLHNHERFITKYLSLETLLATLIIKMTLDTKHGDIEISYREKNTQSKAKSYIQKDSFLPMLSLKKIKILLF